MASPFNLLLTALASVAVVWIGLDTVERWRAAGPRPVIWHRSARATFGLALTFTAAGCAAALILWTYEGVLRRIASDTTIDFLQFSLHPFAAPRLAMASGLVLLHAAAIWAAALVTRLASLRRIAWTAAPRVAAASWILGVGVTLAVVTRIGSPIRIGPLLLAIAVAGLASLVLANLRRRARHASQTARLGALFLALVVPVLAMYPSLVTFATDAKEQLVATKYAPQAVRQREELQNALNMALDDIDAQSSLPDVVGRPKDDGSSTADRAFAVWSATDLATYRLTSAIELYGADGRLVSRFATPNLPEYSIGRHATAGCNWEVPLDVGLLFGSSQRHVLRTSRGVCRGGRTIGSIVVSVMLDYRTLPFIEAQSPYLESLQPEAPAQPEGTFGRDIELAVYGWSRAPTDVFGTSVWQLSDSVFQRLVESREPFWTTMPRENTNFRVFLMSDRGGVYRARLSHYHSRAAPGQPG